MKASRKPVSDYHGRSGLGCLGVFFGPFEAPCKSFSINALEICQKNQRPVLPKFGPLAPAGRPQRHRRVRRLGRLLGHPHGRLVHEFLKEDAFSDAFGGKTLPGGRVEEVTMEQVSPSHWIEYLLAEYKFRVIRQDANGIEAEVADDVALPSRPACGGGAAGSSGA